MALLSVKRWLVGFFLSISSRMEEIKSYVEDMKGSCADIDGVVVLPEYRGNNLQCIMVSYLEKRAKEMGIENVLAEVTFGNFYSKNNLEKLGYRVVNWYQKDKNIKRYIMQKKLDFNNLI